MLPYENATTGKKAIAEMEKLLRGFGASKFGTIEDFDGGEVAVSFVHREQRVTIKASAKGYAAAWLRAHPYSYRMKVSEAEHRRRALAQGNIAVWSIVRDWMKGQVTAIEVGLLSFETAFLAHLVLANGETVLERLDRTDVLKIGSG